jgi:hypothetical protein
VSILSTVDFGYLQDIFFRFDLRTTVQTLERWWVMILQGLMLEVHITTAFLLLMMIDSLHHHRTLISIDFIVVRRTTVFDSFLTCEACDPLMLA